MNLTDLIKANGGYTKPSVANTNNSVTAVTNIANIANVVTPKSSKKNRNIIPEGTRNKHLSHFAGRMLKKYGNADGKAHRAFLKESIKCSPPLSLPELSAIWTSAIGFFEQYIATNPNYIPPAQYNNQPSISELLIVDQGAFSTLCSPLLENRLFNIATARLFMQAYGLTLRLNEMNRRADIGGLPAKYAGEDSTNLLAILVTDAACNLGYKRATSSVVHDTLSVIAADNRYHPVLELLDSTHWDGYDRRPEIYRMLGLTNPLYIVLFHKWSLQAIAVLHNTAINPIAAQGVITFQGFQGIGKTQFLRHLAVRGDFFKEGATLDMSNKDSLMSALRVWICELGEIDSITKKEQSALKAFLTQTTDSFREPYARAETIRPRRTAFCGTVNPQGFLRDETGNRRYWTIPVNNIDLNAVFYYQPEWYAQYWRQILAEYRNNPTGYLLTPQENDMVNMNNEQFEVDVWGENEFITMYDISIDPKHWSWMTAAQIAQSLNEEFKGLNISSESVGQKLLPRICKRLGYAVQRTRGTGGKRLIQCPPLRREGWR
jgi:hypothetical protein